MQKMDTSTIIGLVLILAIGIVWATVLSPSPEELEARQRYQDSVAALNDAALEDEPELTANTDTLDLSGLTDSARLANYGGTFGTFAAAAAGSDEEVTLENDDIRITFATKGGAIKQVELKKFAKVIETEDKEEVKLPLYLLNAERNRFSYTIPVNGVAGSGVQTENLYFQPIVEGNTIALRAPTAEGGYFEQRYSIGEEGYLIDYDVRFENMAGVIPGGTDRVTLEWDTYLDKIEKNSSYEANYSTLYFKPIDEETDYCSCTSSDVEEMDGDEPLKWVASSQQFFTAALIADQRFGGDAVLETETVDEDSPFLEIHKADLPIPITGSNSEVVKMKFYVGPNEFDRLRSIGYDLSDVVSYGNSIFGAINRWMIRPLFKVLASFIPNMGIAILILTLLVKLLVYPLQYKMLVSQEKMRLLKPELEKMKAKHKDDQSAQQMEQMKMYQEYGASPLGGCLPMILQMPIWFALYRFFPASIEFRQENFLWANDLSTYDVLTPLPEWIPFLDGHLSAFAVLWAITTVIYAYYNSRHMDYSAQPMMKYFQYLMPVLFLGFFNSFASGLTAYLFFSNSFNILQTVVTKNFIIDQDKLRDKMNANKKKPKKKNSFSQRLQEAMAEQKRQQAKKK